MTCPTLFYVSIEMHASDTLTLDSMVQAILLCLIQANDRADGMT